MEIVVLLSRHFHERCCVNTVELKKRHSTVKMKRCAFHSNMGAFPLSTYTFKQREMKRLLQRSNVVACGGAGDRKLHTLANVQIYKLSYESRHYLSIVSKYTKISTT